MTHVLRNARAEPGFTLVELLVVVSIIGILSAVALPAFLGQRAKAEDATAKSNARNLAAEIEACYHADGGYTGCTAQLTRAATGLPIGAGSGEVRVTRETTDGYEIVATSTSHAGGADHTFTLVHNVGGAFDHDCAARGEGGCPSDGNW